ncbi:MAG: DUF5681 domain-containing protein [Candidatus Sulfotelmatobacter sp.]
MGTNSDEQEEAPEQPRQTGYGNPPESSRFKKGQSGNPKGRRKGSHNVATVLAATLREKVVVNENGARRTVTKLEAAIKQLVNKAATGDLRVLQQFIALAREAEAAANLPSTERSALGELDQRVLQGILKRFQPEPENGEPE